MHWVDMEWLWGYHVLGGSVRDMLAFCQATGAKGSVNFDGIGCERLAVEAPAALADLRAAIAAGTVEVAGASYGQRYMGEGLPRTDSRLHRSLHTDLGAALGDYELIHDHPYGVSAMAPSGDSWRKVPTGDWITSPQVYEQVHRPFTALQLLDFVAVEGPASGANSRGLLFLHDGSQAFWREDSGIVKQVLTMYEAWDEDYYVDRIDVRMRVVPHGALTHAERWKRAQEFVRPVAAAVGEGAGGELPATFAGLWCAAPNVAVTALYRETPDSGAALEAYAAAEVAYPYVVHLVEWNGQGGPVQVAFPGAIHASRRTNLLSELVAPSRPPRSRAPDRSARMERRHRRPPPLRSLHPPPRLGRSPQTNPRPRQPPVGVGYGALGEQGRVEGG